MITHTLGIPSDQKSYPITNLSRRKLVQLIVSQDREKRPRGYNNALKMAAGQYLC